MSSHKRKFDNHNQNHHSHGPTPKKQRPENGYPLFSRGHSQDSQLPELPPISREYEKIVFTHSSIATLDPHTSKTANYERLEFLGDAQLEHIASVIIYERYQDSTPGKMSSIREELVRNETLSKFTRMYGLDKRLNINLGTYQPRDWTKIHGDVFEAYVAAVILSDIDEDYGFKTAERWLTKLWEPILADLGLKMMATKDIKSKEELGRSLLVKGAKINYIDEKESIVDHARGSQTYFIAAYYTGLGYDNVYLGRGQAESKNAAGQSAARNALQNPLIEEIKRKREAFLEEKAKLDMEQAAKEKAEQEKKQELKFEKKKDEEQKKQKKETTLTTKPGERP